MVDERRVRRLLQRVTDDLSYLRRTAGRDRQGLLADDDGLRATKYAFVTAIEGCLSAAQHICASEGWGPPASNADAMRVLGRHDVIPSELAPVMARAVGFRNVLVHGYAEVDDQLVVGFLDSIVDLDGFVSAVSAWVNRSAG